MFFTGDLQTKTQGRTVRRQPPAPHLCRTTAARLRTNAVTTYDGENE